MVEDNIIVGGVIALIGGFMLYHGFATYRERQSIIDVSEDTASVTNDNSEGAQLIQGQLEVEEPATPTTAPDELTDSVSCPGVWAWRIQRKESRSSGNRGTSHRWRTVDGELAVGDITVYADGRSIEVDSSILDSVRVEPENPGIDPFSGTDLSSLSSSTDPLEDNRLYLEDGVQTVNLEQGGFLQDIIPDSVTISIGNMTSDPDRYQAAILEDEDHVWMIGTIDRNPQEDVITEPETTSFRLFDRDPETVKQSLRKKAIGFGAVGIVFAVVGGVIASGLVTG